MAEDKRMQTMKVPPCAGRHCRNGGGRMETGKEKVQPVITGTFPAQRFFDTLAAILSRRENVTITVTVTQEGEQQRKAAV